MAKEEKKTVAAAAEVTKEAPKLPELPEKYKFICSMCEYYYTKENKGSICSKLRLTGKFCDNVQNLIDDDSCIRAENEKHRKYIKAFNQKAYYTEEEILSLYNAAFNTGELINPDEFIAYCRAMGMKVV